MLKVTDHFTEKKQNRTENTFNSGISYRNIVKRKFVIDKRMVTVFTHKKWTESQMIENEKHHTHRPAKAKPSK